MVDDIAPLGPKARSEASTAIAPAVSAHEIGITEAEKILARGESLRTLSARQECFAECVANGDTASAAYRYAYSVPSTEIPSQVGARASVLMRTPQVAWRIKTLKAERDSKLLRDRDKTQRYVIDKLQQIIELPGSHHSARVHALTLLAKASGLFDGAENGANARADKRSAAELERELRDRLGALLGENAKHIKGLDVIEAEPGKVIANNLQDSPGDSEPISDSGEG